jgi:transglutaminase-like putative cysteine protease
LVWIQQTQEQVVEYLERYLRPTPNIDCDNSAIVEKARDLTRAKQETRETAASLFYFVRDAIKYNAYRFILAPGYFQASKTLRRGDGFCIQKAVLLVALARAAGIPARLLFADVRNHLAPQKIVDYQGTNLFTTHGYCELYIDGKWVKATPAFDLKTCQENRIIPVEFNGSHDSILHSHNQDGKLHIEYVKMRGHYDDVPLQELIDAAFQVYGVELTESYKSGTWVTACQ